MIKNKIKQLLVSKGVTQNDIAEYQHIARQSVNNKISRATFKINDLIDIAEVTKTNLAFVDKNGEVIVKFTKEDIKKTDGR